MFLQKENVSSSNTHIKEKVQKLENFIRTNIPASEFMDVHVTELSNHSIKISAPHEPNSNHYGTTFGGSISTLGIIAGWALIHFKMDEEKIETVLAIQESKTKFYIPIKNEIEAVNNSLPPEAWEEFRDEFLKTGKAKIRIRSEIYSGGNLCAMHEGCYVALPKKY